MSFLPRTESGVFVDGKDEESTASGTRSVLKTVDTIITELFNSLQRLFVAMSGVGYQGGGFFF